MKTIILAGGLGTRLEEETTVKPKPMVEIGGKPMLMHIMGIYARHGYNEFLVACGYRGEYIKEYFASFFLRNSDWSINLRDGSHEIAHRYTPDWHVELVDTGKNTGTGGRITRMRDRLAGERFLVTYGDGLANIDIGSLVEFHKAHGKLSTVTAVRPPARFGGLEIDGDSVVEYSEKPQTSAGWINGGFFVFEPGVFDYVSDESESLERGALERLADAGELMAFRHAGFWQPMDTLREKRLLEELAADGNPPWDPTG